MAKKFEYLIKILSNLGKRSKFEKIPCNVNMVKIWSTFFTITENMSTFKLMTKWPKNWPKRYSIYEKGQNLIKKLSNFDPILWSKFDQNVIQIK